MRRGVAAVTLVVAVATVAACGYEDPRLQQSEVDGPPTTLSASASSAVGAPPTSTTTDVAETETLVAQAPAALAKVEVFAQPGAAAPVRSIESPGEYGNPQVFLVREREDGWLRVDLPVRPNGSGGWIRESDVDVTQHDYRIEVRLGAFRLRLWKGDQQLLDEPIGVGTSDTPTPGGTYFTWVLLDPTTSAYGAYAYGLSGFSEKLSSFAGSDARLGIHGTPDASSIGRNVSSGCIRMHDEALVRMVEQIRLPLGIPVTVLA